MVELIQELLLTHNCVVIPGFGALIGNYKPADVRLYEQKIYPPSKSIAFNRSLQVNDGLLVNALVVQSGLTYNEAESKVMAFSKECLDSLHSNKALILKDIGKFTIDEAEQIQFQPFNTKNYNPESIGLERLEIIPIQRLKDMESELKANYQRVLHPEKMQDAVVPRKKSKISYAVAAFFASALVISSLAWNIHSSNPYRSASSIVPAFEKKTDVPVLIEQEPVQQTTENTEEETIVKEEVVLPTEIPTRESEIKEPVQHTVAPVHKSYIVVGAFFDEEHASKVKALAESKGYQAVITLDYNNLIYRVSVETPSEGLDTILPKIKSSINQRAWVYCNQCKL